MKKWYAVRRGLFLGVFDDWQQVQQSITDVESPEFKSFPTKKLAESWFQKEPRVECDFNILRKGSKSSETEFQLSYKVLDWKSSFQTTDQQKLIDKIQSVLKQSASTNFTLNDIHIYSKLKTLPQFATYFQSNKVRYTGKIFSGGVSIPNTFSINRPVVINKSL